MTEQEQFLAAIAASPDDAHLRNVYSDWLLDHDQPEEAERQRRWLNSERWLRAFVATADCPDYDTLVEAALAGGDSTWDDDYLHFRGIDAHGEIPAEFWDHLEVVTGQKPRRKPSRFSCSC